MLTSMGIQNFALIEKMNLQFNKGITIFTGETGAGKSILMDAFSILLGERASSDFIRHETERFLLEGVFEVEDNLPLLKFLEEQNIFLEDGKLILSRSFSRQGKSTILANGHPLTLKVLKEIGQLLADIHGQYSSQRLLDEETPKHLLDTYSEESKKAYLTYLDTFKKYQNILHTMKDLEQRASEREREMEMLQWQLSEIYESNIQIGEDELISKELTQLDNYEQLMKGLSGCCEAFYEEPYELLSKVSTIREEIKHLLQYAPDLENAKELIEGAYFQLEECGQILTAYQDSVSFSEERYRYCQERDTLLYQLKKKYGPTLEDVLSYAEKGQTRLDELENMSFIREELEQELEQSRQDLEICLDTLQRVRDDCSYKISNALEREVKALGMVHGKFSFVVEKLDAGEFNVIGAKNISLLFSANQGEQMLPLAKIASGGELSRIALACQAVFNQEDNKTLVFDEIDVGISGQAALQVAERILQIAKNRQVFCITHMPQTAAIANQHYHLQKSVIEKRTISTLTALTESEHIERIAAMMSGQDNSEVAKKMAFELVQKLGEVYHNPV